MVRHHHHHQLINPFNKSRYQKCFPDSWHCFLVLKIPRKDGSGADNKTPYSYGYFHFVFATGAMYFAMLFIGWNPHRTMHKYGSSHKFGRTLLLDVTITSICTQYFCVYDVQVEYWCWLDECVGENCKRVAGGGPLRWVLKMWLLENQPLISGKQELLDEFTSFFLVYQKWVVNKDQRNSAHTKIMINNLQHGTM